MTEPVVTALLRQLRRVVLERFVVADTCAWALVASALVVHALDTSATVHRISYLVPILFGAASAVVAAASAPRRERSVPTLIAAGIALTAFSDGVWQALDAAGVSPSVPIDHPPRIAGFVLIAAAMWVVIARTHPGRRLGPAFAVDVATVLVVCALVLWTVSFGRAVTAARPDSYESLVWMSYPVADAVLLALLSRMLLNPRARPAVGAAFALGIGLWLASDIAYLVSPGGAGEHVMESAWMLAPALLSRGAWTWRGVVPVAVDEESRSDWWTNLVVAVVPLLVPPAIEVAMVLQGQPHDHVLLAAGSVALVALAALRTVALLRTEEQALRELAQAHEAALAASRDKSVFVMTMSHEIRTPLTIVLASAEMLEDTDLDEEQRDLQLRMSRSGARLHSLVEDVLDFSRIEAGHVEVAAVPFDLAVVLDELAEVYRPRAADAGLAFEAHLDPRLPRVLVGDAGRLVQVAANLLDNAFRFTESGTVSVVVRPAEAAYAPAGESVVPVEVVVTDTGVGIPADRLDHVFGAFAQADAHLTGTAHYAGTGLGLAICRELVALMGGSVSVRSEPGRGSEFVASVQLVVPPDPPPAGVAAPVTGTVLADA